MSMALRRTTRAQDARRRWHEVVTYDRITTDPAVMGGVPCIRGLRFAVATVLAMLADGMGAEDLAAGAVVVIHEDLLRVRRLPVPG
jgi:hypothetical protein